MRQIMGTLAVVAAIAVVVQLAMFWKVGPMPRGAPTPRPEGNGWINLLDAAHAPQWRNITDDRDIFAIRDGILHIPGGSAAPLRYAAYTGERFGDLELHIEFKVTWRANSGVFLRVHPEDPVHRGFEVQVLDDHTQAPNKNGSGSIYDVASPMFNMALPRGEWNSYDITVRGRQVIVVMNGWKVIDTDFAQMNAPIGKFSTPFAQLPLEGLIALQDHGGEVWYRNIFVRKL
ncbi:MAG TPA: DUF1080 domain-containing protein [Candidatus Hydrogenedentes bacterium]|nr:DUF1080 domain-containing protein [Candidatus Hydrogenedentota bacterium]HNT87572.1 DUF1080 domain-containing protein [Candidatus Hydrogenedentota bacterium]